MSPVLTIDTSLNKTYLTYGTKNVVIESDEKNYHSAYLISALKDILQGETPSSIGVNMGPGSFTGIRVGLTVARVMSQQMKCPLVGVSSCEILSAINNNSAVIMDARRSMYYYYDGQKTELLPKEGIAKLEKQKVVCDRNSLPMLEELGFEVLSFEDGNYPLGDALAKLTKEKLEKSKKEFHWSKLKPLYIQTPPIFGKG